MRRIGSAKRMDGGRKVWSLIIILFIGFQFSVLWTKVIDLGAPIFRRELIEVRNEKKSFFFLNICDELILV